MASNNYSAREFFWLIINATLVLAMVFGLVGIGTLVRYSNAIIPSRTITVSGEGKTEIAPDIATYSFSVVSSGKDTDLIQQENTKKMNQAITFVKEQGVKAEDIKTTGYNLYPRYAYDRDTGKQSLDGYELTQSVVVKIRNLDNVGKVLSGLVKAGVNQAGDLRYSIEKPEAQRAKARQEAFDNAYTKASQMAAQNGVHIARVINFSESTNGGGPIYYVKGAPMAVGMGGDSAPNTEPGTEEVNITVTVTYEIQ